MIRRTGTTIKNLRFKALRSDQLTAGSAERLRRSPKLVRVRAAPSAENVAALLTILDVSGIAELVPCRALKYQAKPPINRASGDCTSRSLDTLFVISVGRNPECARQVTDSSSYPIEIQDVTGARRTANSARGGVSANEFVGLPGATGRPPARHL